ncbi:phage tail protein [Floridanema aerugineum]|uniref:Phage tail protein n=1 Tax=Floridaenema aerugineum BLCC-F46 TaxID=3153654 RepID=A0ABV4XFK9_9CYAN
MASSLPTYFLLDSQQGRNAEEGWRVQTLTNMKVTAEGLQLAPLPGLPKLLNDAAGTFSGLSNPTGVAVDNEGIIYIADAQQHRIFRLIRRDGLQVWATYFQVKTGLFASDRFVYIPAATRLERWQPSPETYPKDFADVEVISESVWNQHQAEKLIRCYIETVGAKHLGDNLSVKPKSLYPNASPCQSLKTLDDLEEQEVMLNSWEAPYPLHLPGGTLCKSSIDILPGLGGLGNAPRQFNTPRGLAISHTGNLYVADSQNHRIQVFSLSNLSLQKIWGKKEPGSMPGEFNEPWDVVVDAQEMVYIADRNNHRVQKVNPRTESFTLIDGTRLNAHIFQVLYGSERRERFVFIPAQKRLERWAASLGRDPLMLDEVTLVSDAVSSLDVARFMVLEILNAKGSTDILVEWERDYPLAFETPFVHPIHLAIDRENRLYVVDEEKDFVTVLDCQGRVLGKINYSAEFSGTHPPAAIAIDTQGKLIIALKTGLHRIDFQKSGISEGCINIWKGCCHGMALDISGDLIAIGEDGVAQLSPSKGFEKEGMYVSSCLDSAIERCQWHKIVLETDLIPTGTSFKVWTYASDYERSPDEIAALSTADWQTGQVNGNDFLILSPPGRFLWLKIEMVSNKTETPTLKRLKIHFPRITYLQYLPAVYQADPISKDFLERFLSIFETVLGSVENKIDFIVRYFDPNGVPDRAFLEWLAAWVDMSFYSSWSLETCRRLLRNAPELYRLRGTPAGLKRWLSLAFGVEAEILEHFCLRQGEYLNQQLVLGERSHLWGNSLLDRSSLGDTHLGELLLEKTAPAVNLLSSTAHRFTVFIPATQLRPPERERQIRALIDAEKPGHTQYTLNSVEPRLRVGVQSRLGMDTLVGTYPRLVLNYCSTLGSDTILSRASPNTSLPVNSHRIGINFVVS